MANQRNHNFLLNECMLLEILAQAQDIIHHIQHIFIIHLRRQVLEDDIQQIIQFALDVAMGLQELTDAIGRVALACHEGSDMGEHLFFLMKEVGHNLRLYSLKKLMNTMPMRPLNF